MSEEGAKIQTESELARGVDPQGFFTVRIHTSQGLERIIGVLMTSVDMIKAFYIEQHQRSKEKSIVQPRGNSMLDRFRNKWQ